MKEGFWFNVRTGLWFEVDDHAAFLKREASARMTGLPEEVVLQIQAMPHRYLNGSSPEGYLASNTIGSAVTMELHHRKNIAIGFPG